MDIRHIGLTGFSSLFVGPTCPLLDILGTLNTGAMTEGAVACFFFLFFAGGFFGDTERRSNDNETEVTDGFAGSDMGEGLLEGGALKDEGIARFVEGRAWTMGPFYIYGTVSIIFRL
jgi:hypothetical protein